MSAYNRYYFTKNVYSDYIVILVKKDRLYSYDIDMKLLKYLKFNNKVNILKKLKINYLILDNLDIIEINNYKNNNLYKYMNILYLNKIFKEIKVIMLQNM